MVPLQVPRGRREMLVCKVCGEPQVLKVPKVLKEKEVKQTNYSFQIQALLSSLSTTKRIFF